MSARLGARQGFYAMLLRGALEGLGCGLASRRRSAALGAASTAIALGAGIISEWRFAPFAADEGLGYFLGRLH